MGKKCNWRPFSFLLTLLCTVGPCIVSYCQNSFSLFGPTEIEMCGSSKYEFLIDGFSACPDEDLVLILVFEHSVEYLSNSLGLLPTSTDSRSVTLNLNELAQPISGSIEVIPVCADSLVTMNASATVMLGDSMNSVSTNVINAFGRNGQLTFGNYTYNELDNQLYKTITLTNDSNSPIESFDIVLTYEEEFAVLAETSLGRISDMNQISVNSSDLTNGSLEPLESINITLIHDLLACSIKIINYEISISCDLAQCNIIQTFVDDIEVDRTILEQVASSSTTIDIEYQDAYTIELGEELSIKPKEEVRDTSFEFTWQPADLISCVSCSEIVIKPMKDMELLVTVLDYRGCMKIETISITVLINLKLYLPNVISGRGNTSNSTLFPSKDASIERILNFRIFDRWGNVVMDKENLDPLDDTEGWQGTIGNQQASSGVYVYDINLLLIDGSTQRFTSSVTLL